MLVLGGPSFPSFRPPDVTGIRVEGRRGGVWLPAEPPAQARGPVRVEATGVALGRACGEDFLLRGLPRAFLLVFLALLGLSPQASGIVSELPRYL